MSTEWICPECGRADGAPAAGAVCPHDKRVLIGIDLLEAAASDPVLGRVIGGQYAVYDRLGRGGMGAVYRAVHQRLGRHVALKTILPDRVDEDGDELRARFELEARLLSELRHPGIVGVYDSGVTEDGRHYLVMEFVSGLPMRHGPQGGVEVPGAATGLEDPAAASLPDRIKTFLAVCDAVHYAHQRGVIHRDLKPSNVVVSETGPEAPGSSPPGP